MILILSHGHPARSLWGAGAGWPGMEHEARNVWSHQNASIATSARLPQGLSRQPAPRQRPGGGRERQIDERQIDRDIRLRE